MVHRSRAANRQCLSAAIFLAATGTAHAQIATDGNTASSTPTADQAQKMGDQRGGLGEIVVTATRRATNVQDVPISITAVGGTELAAKGISSGADLNKIVPNLFATAGYGTGNLRYSI